MKRPLLPATITPSLSMNRAFDRAINDIWGGSSYMERARQAGFIL